MPNEEDALNEAAYGAEAPVAPPPTEKEMNQMAEAFGEASEKYCVPRGLSDYAEAEFLSRRMTDTVFEHLLRIRCREEAKMLVWKGVADESHIRFRFWWAPERDTVDWSVEAGTSYSNKLELSGEILSRTCGMVADAQLARQANKLALPAPSSEG